MCDAHLFEGPLVCVLPSNHLFGHRFESTSGQAHVPKEGI
jgi:hypothetical protein